MPEKIRQAEQFFAENNIQPKIFFILGSGIDITPITHKCQDVREYSFSDIPGFPKPTVSGHDGKIVLGNFTERLPMAIFFGRKHIYEGNVEDTIFVPRIMSKLGAEIGIFTSSMGAIDTFISPGDLVLLTDIINYGGIWTARYSQICKTGSRNFKLFDRELSEKFIEYGRKLGICFKSGVAGFCTGPTYETPAEVKMLRTLGVSVVSMSMAPEVTMANANKIRCVGIALVTNRAGEHSDHSEVLKSARLTSTKITKVIEHFLVELSERRNQI
ncbi:hypothetical protein DRQ33_05805 [bacterium]|nr:MAG: hypothetical protein DRQ33_05805 [bacterium]